MLSIIQEHIKAQKDINAYDIKGNTLLHQAVKRGDKEAVSFLLENGAVQKANKAGETPLFVLSDTVCDVEIARLLLEKEPFGIYDTDSEKTTPLMQAAAHGYLDLVRFFVEKGMDVNDKNSQGETALTIACDATQTAVVRYLLEQKANTEMVDAVWGRTLFNQAIVDGNKELVTVLLEGGVAPTGPKEGKGYVCPPLVLACLLEQYEIAGILLDNGADPNQSDVVEDCTPLVATIDKLLSGTSKNKLKAYNMIRTLVQKGADPLPIKERYNDILHETKLFNLHRQKRCVAKENTFVSDEVVALPPSVQKTCIVRAKPVINLSDMTDRDERGDR